MKCQYNKTLSYKLNINTWHQINITLGTLAPQKMNAFSLLCKTRFSGQGIGKGIFLLESRLYFTTRIHY